MLIYSCLSWFLTKLWECDLNRGWKHAQKLFMIFLFLRRKETSLSLWVMLVKKKKKSHLWGEYHFLTFLVLRSWEGQLNFLFFPRHQQSYQIMSCQSACLIRYLHKFSSYFVIHLISCSQSWYSNCLNHLCSHQDDDYQQKTAVAAGWGR